MEPPPPPKKEEEPLNNNTVSPIIGNPTKEPTAVTPAPVSQAKPSSPTSKLGVDVGKAPPQKPQKKEKKPSSKASSSSIQDPFSGKKVPWCNFPCCWGFPLEIGLQVVFLLDVIISILTLALLSTLLGIDVFAHKERFDKHNSYNTTAFGQVNKEKGIPHYINPLETTTTTTVPPWTIRTVQTLPPIHLPTEDVDVLSKEYSKLANKTKKNHHSVLKGCGRDYFVRDLYSYELVKTKGLWEEFLWTMIVAEALYTSVGLLGLICICCFVEHRGSKLLIMLLWWVEWAPMFLYIRATILCQSKRLCIMEYGGVERDFNFHGQFYFLIFLLVRLLICKPFQLLLHFFYIRELLVYGYLKDETVVRGMSYDPCYKNLDEGLEFLIPPGESEFSKSYFKQFYKLEAKLAGVDTAQAYASPKTLYPLAFDILTPAEVINIQMDEMTGKENVDDVEKEEAKTAAGLTETHKVTKLG